MHRKARQNYRQTKPQRSTRSMATPKLGSVYCSSFPVVRRALYSLQPSLAGSVGGVSTRCTRVNARETEASTCYPLCQDVSLPPCERGSTETAHDSLAHRHIFMAIF
ncbi:hypothetical protein BsWGS_27351 [Bradybaena similaris]